MLEVFYANKSKEIKILYVTILVGGEFKMDHESMGKVMRYIDDHIYQDITLEDIATYVGYSKYHLSKIFHTYMNISIMKYVKKRKLVVSVEELMKGKKIIDIAFRMGYSSHSSFTKAFIREFGVSPILVKLCFVMY